MRTVYVGIDPGLKGAWAAITPTGEVLCHAVRPIEGRVDAGDLLGSLRSAVGPGFEHPHGAPVVAVEKVHAMPKQGVSSSFKFGVNYGIVLGVVASLGYRLELVTPQAWKKVILAGVGDKDKKATIAWATRAYPNVSLIPPGGRVPSDGIADALAIAEFCRRTYR